MEEYRMCKNVFCIAKCQVSCELYGTKTVDVLLDKILAINELADYYEIDLKQI